MPIDNKPWPIIEDQLTGVRGLFEFETHVLHNNGLGYKLKPTMPAEEFAVNPPPLEAGVFMDQITVVFKPGTPAAAVDAINEEIGASVLISPILGTAYRMKLPSKTSLEDAFAFYRAKPSVQGVLPAINYGLHHLEDALVPNEFGELPPDDPGPFPARVARLTHGWFEIQSAIGAVGRRTVRVGVIDTGVDIANADIALNIAINQGEVPAGLMVVDMDGDGIISFVDLNAPENQLVRPLDVNMNGFVDGVDLISDPTWANGVDDDDLDMDPNSFVDDLVGWDFFNNTNDPRGDLTARNCLDGHGMCVASLLGAVGNNGMGIAGVAWAVSIVPMQAGTGRNAVPDVTFLSAAHYAEATGVDVVNVSQGWNIASENADFDCADKKKQSTIDVPQSDFAKGIESGRNAYRVPPFVDDFGNVTSRVLYVFSAGNSGMDVGSSDIVGAPSELFKDVLGANVVIVGAAFDHGSSSPYSNYGSPVVGVWAPAEWNEVFGAGAITPSGSLAGFNGTSAAAPVVSGLAALALSRFPMLVGDPVALHNHVVDRSVHSIAAKPDRCDAKEDFQPRVDAEALLVP